jgi:transcription initiation factor IIE alpha subunit
MICEDSVKISNKAQYELNFNCQCSTKGHNLTYKDNIKSSNRERQKD